MAPRTEHRSNNNHFKVALAADPDSGNLGWAASEDPGRVREFPVRRARELEFLVAAGAVLALRAVDFEGKYPRHMGRAFVSSSLRIRRSLQLCTIQKNEARNLRNSGRFASSSLGKQQSRGRAPQTISLLDCAPVK